MTIIKKNTVNILTRTSNRPIGFRLCRESIKRQTYQNIKHIISYANDNDLNYIDNENTIKVKVQHEDFELTKNPDGFLYAPYNLFINDLLKEVNEGWIMILDDDDNLIHNNVIKEITQEIENIDEDTMLIWQMRYPSGVILPPKKNFITKKIVLKKIGSPCIAFHSKYKSSVSWDHWKGADFRFIKQLEKIIPKKKWIKKVFIQLNNHGGYGKNIDISKEPKLGILFNKNLLWYLIPKYHFTFFNKYIFHKNFYINLVRRVGIFTSKKNKN